MPQTAIEKIVNRYAVGLAPGERVHAGDFVTIRPKHVMTHDNTGAVIPKFASITGEGGRVRDPGQPVFAMDHDIQNRTPENLGKYAKIAAFARKHKIDYYPPGRGIAHQVMVEEGYATPGTLIVGSDSHSNLYGAVCAVGTPVVRTDAAAIWATGQTWWQIPPQVRVELTGGLRRGVTGKDVIITLCGLFREDEVLNAAVEFAGEGVASLSVEERLTISNMTTEWGTLVGMFPFDEVLRAYLLGRARHFAARGDAQPRYTEADVARWWDERAGSSPDEGAAYSKVLTLDLSTVSPYVSGPNSVKVMRSVAEIEPERVGIRKAYLMSCVNARLSDFAEAAGVFAEHGAGARVADGVEFYIAAASSEVEAEAKTAGYWGTLVGAGARVLPPGCGACIGLGEGTLEAGEVGISATNRNFEGRMGSREARCYLASPSVVAESAVRGYIAAPASTAGAVEPRGACRVMGARAAAKRAQEILEGFPERVVGRVLYLPMDNLNTDGIYGKDVTYRDDITLAEQGQYAMLNYDPAFQGIARVGDIIVGGRNFGSGSSREQAATALASRGIRLVVTASVSQTYSRNAYNNGYVVLECASLTDQLAGLYAAEVSAGRRTIVGPELVVDFRESVMTCAGRVHGFGALSTTAQELVVAGGSEAVVAAQLARSR